MVHLGLMAAAVSQMLGELVAAGLGPEHVDTLCELYEKVRAAEQAIDSPPGMPADSVETASNLRLFLHVTCV